MQEDLYPLSPLSENIELQGAESSESTKMGSSSGSAEHVDSDQSDDAPAECTDPTRSHRALKCAVPKVRGRPFVPGQSGNPNGRPRGARNRVTLAVEALIEGQAEELTRKAIDARSQDILPYCAPC